MGGERTGGYIGAVVDDDFEPHGQCFKWDEMGIANVRRVARVEPLMERCIVAGGAFQEFVERFREAVKKELSSSHCVGLKTICAYRCGLDIVTQHDMSAVEAVYLESSQHKQQNGGVRVVDRSLISFLLEEAVKLLRNQQVLQVHTGFGDNDLSLHLSDPSLLTPFVRAHPSVPIVLLHAGYPFTRNAGYMASVFPNVFVDFGLAIPLLSSQGMDNTVAELLELSPIRKVLFASDAHTYPHLFLLAATYGRIAVYNALSKMLLTGDLTLLECIAVAHDVLYRNALKLYGLEHKGRL